MKMHKQNKIFLSLAITLVLSILIVPLLIVQVKAEENKYSNCTYKNALEYYNLTYEYDLGSNMANVKLRAAAGTFKIAAIDEGIYDDEINDDLKAYTKVDEGTHITNKNEVIGKIIYPGDNQNNPIIKLSSLGSESTENRSIRVTIEVAKSDSLCASKADYDAATLTNSASATVTLYYYIPIPKSGKLSSEVNRMYNKDACRFMRGEISSYNTDINDSILKKYNAIYRNEYQQLLPFCFSPNNVSTNYTDTQLDTMISSALLTATYLKVNSSTTSSGAGASEISFNEMKRLAYQQGSSHVYENRSPSDDIIELKCNYNTIASSRKEDGSYNYENKQYYYASSTVTSSVEYKYNYDGIEKTENKNICSKKCEEAVEVSYGPPQAVIAGFCFEYQVKVVSRVQCETQVDYSAMPTQQGYCTPEPVCEHKNGLVLSQAGPAEEFNACVKECDGGKYTQSCSQKCYDKVYANDTTTKKTSFFTTARIQPVADVTSNGKYVRLNDGTIVWEGSGFSRWYKEYDHKSYNGSSGYFYADSNGFKRKHYTTSGTECNGVCYNTGCSGDVYLNPESAQSDYVANLQRFQEAVRTCQAGATCTTNASTYNIQISYKVNGKSDEEVVKYEQKELVGGSTNPNAANDDSILLSYDGCYNGTANDYYKAEWSFPGTWVNNKTGEISFTPKSTGWHQSQNKICLPLDTANENVAWWNWYMTQKKGETNSLTGSYTSKEYQDTCQTPAGSNSPSSINWNIFANTRLFGYFGWNFDIRCFYASNSNNETTTETACRTDFDNFEIRPVTNEDLFPSEDESGIASSTNSTGRTPGFNWTQAATIPISKNYYYNTNPEILITKIQTIGDKLYTQTGDDEQEYLDYEFELTPTDLNKIKRYNKDNGYDYYGGTREYDSNAKVFVYRSNLFRDGSIISESAVKKLGLLGCNNQASDTRCITTLSLEEAQ